MHTRNVQFLSKPPDVPRDEAEDVLPFLVLGGTPPLVPGVNFRATVGSPCLGIILINRIDPAELASVLDEAPDPAVPIADFNDNRALRCDFVGDTLDLLDPAAIAELRRRFAPIWRRLAELPFAAPREDRAELTAMRLAYSRDTAITASLAPGSPLLVEYPLLGHSAGTRYRLEALADLDLLRRRHFTRTHACGKCGSARLHAYEACPGCGGGELSDEPIVHHFRCGWQEPQPRFVQGQQLICPKCRRELRHFGVDYGKPGNLVLCRACGAANAEPIVNFVCLDCSSVMPAADAKACDWYHYDLTEEGVRALKDGRLPRCEIAPLLSGDNRAFSAREFRLLVSEGMRIATRYQRPFTVARLSMANVDVLRHESGATKVDAAFRLAVNVIIELLRDSDFVTADGATAILVGFPETAGKDVAKIVDRLFKRIQTTVSEPLELGVRTAEGEAIAELLAES